MTMIVERSMSDGWLTNTYLVAAGENSDAFLVDAGGPMEPLFAKAEELGLNVTHVLLTHHHGDHVSALGDTLERYPDAIVLAHPDERVPGTTGDMHPGDELDHRRPDGQGPAHAGPHRRHAQPARRRPGAVHRRHAVQGLGRRRARARQHLLRGHQALDHGRDPHAPAGDRPAPRPHRPEHGRRRARAQPVRAHLARRWTRRAASSARRSASPRRSSSGAPTTTAATRPGCAGPTVATTSCPGPKSSVGPLVSKG